MRRGDFTAAWAVSDAVLAKRSAAGRDDPRLPYHLRWVWDGRAFRGSDVLVRCYHGLGDTIQFARYLPVLRQHVTTLTVEVQPELLPLLATVPGPDRLVPFRMDAPMPPSACDLEIMELAHALRLSPADVPVPPYMAVSPAPVSPGAIGLCWQSGGWDPERTVPEAMIDDLIECLGGPGGMISRFGSAPQTQRDPAFYTLQPTPTMLSVRNPSGVTSSIEQTAALVAGLDLVITVDTMVAHLAGALNRPTWLLLQHDADWRWMARADSSPWYPSMRLYRQPKPGDWASVIAHIATDLMERVQAQSPTNTKIETA